MGSRPGDINLERKVNVRTGVRSERYKDAQGFSTEKEITTHSTEAKMGVYTCFALVGVFILYCFIYAASKTYHYHPPEVPFVKTSCGNSTGTIYGARDSAVYALGIFYAIPYGTAARWQPPRSLNSGNCWQGTYNGTFPGKVCYQFGALTSTQNQSEDCLNLNVWTKNWQKEKPPAATLVFIHGGGNVYGSANSYRDLINLVRNNDDVCVVAPNFRLNAFGFLALRELSQNDSRGLNISGNYGILDIQLALRWVQANVAAFGCDPSRVTLVGHASGGTNVLGLFASTQASGLFHRAVIWSGSLNVSVPLSQAEAQNRQGFLQNSPCSNATNVGSCLQNLTANQILQSIPNGSNNGSSWLPSSFWPTNPAGLNVPGIVIIDGDVVELPYYTALTAGAYLDVPVWFQSTLEELEIYPNATITSLNQTDYNTFLTNNFAPWSSSAGSTIANLYANATAQSVLKSYNDLRADLGIYCANAKVASTLASAINGPVYLSVVVQPPSAKVQIYPDSTGALNAFQGWDFMAAAPSWNYFQSSSGSILGGSQQGSVGGYRPSNQDIAFGNLLRTQLLNFTSSGVIRGFNRVDINDGQYNVGVLGNALRNSTITQVPNYRQEFCNPLRNALGLSDSDSRFWFSN